MSNSKEVKEWLQRINFSLAWRKPYEDEWYRNIDLLKGQCFEYSSDEDRIYVNMVHPHVRVVIPAIYSRNPDILVTPSKTGREGTDELARKRAEVMQRVQRYFIKELDVKAEVKLCILDAVLIGHAWIKSGYETEIEDTQKETKTFIGEFLNKLGINQSDESEQEQDEKDSYINSKIISERPWALRTSPFDMIVPALSRRVEELPWISERIIMPTDEAQEKYNVPNLKPSANANQLLAALRGSKYKNLGYGDDIQFSILYEIWDGKSKKVLTISDNYNEYLDEKESEYTFLDSKYHPYIQLRFNEITDEFYPVSDITPAIPQIEELNETRSQMINHRKRYNRRYVTKPGAFDPQAKADLKSGEDGVVTEVSQTMLEMPLADVIMPIQDAPLPPEVYSVENRVRDDLFTILGTSDYASQASAGARTATEASIIATQSRFRVEERIDLVGTFVNRIIRNLAMISQKYMSPLQIMDIVGMDAVFWLKLKKDSEIRGEFLYDITYASTAPINRELDREQFMQFYSLARNDPYYDQVKIRLQLARKFDLDQPETWLVEKITKMLTQQRLEAAKSGMLLEGTVNAPGSNGGSTGPDTQAPVSRLPTGQPQGLPGDVESTPPVPGGTGGTNLV